MKNTLRKCGAGGVTLVIVCCLDWLIVSPCLISSCLTKLKPAANSLTPAQSLPCGQWNRFNVSQMPSKWFCSFGIKWSRLAVLMGENTTMKESCSNMKELEWRLFTLSSWITMLLLRMMSKDCSEGHLLIHLRVCRDWLQLQRHENC